MKKMLLTLLLALSAQADVILFECGENDKVYLSAFEGVGEIRLDDAFEQGPQQINGSLAIILRDAGNEGKLSSVVSMNLEGDIKTLNDISKDEVKFAEFVADVNGEKLHFSLLLDFAKNLSSRINDRATGKSYQANCTITSRK